MSENAEALDVADNLPTDPQDNISEPSEVEKKAASLGWRPDKYAEDDPRYKTAEQFMAKANADAPLLKARVDRQERELAEMRKLHRQQMESQRIMFEAQVKELKERRREAIQTGDADAVDKLDAQIDQTNERIREVKVPEVQENPAQSPEWQAFADRHAHWLDKDQEVTQDAIQIANRLRTKQASEGWTEKEFIVHLERRLRDLHGDRLEPKKPQADVDTPIRRGTQTPNSVMTAKGRKSFRDLPAEGVAAYEYAKKLGAFRGMTDADAQKFYVENYIW